jgi:hypothetical protein
LVLRNDQTGVPTANDSVTGESHEMLENNLKLLHLYAVLTEEIWQILAERTAEA